MFTCKHTHERARTYVSKSKTLRTLTFALNGGGDVGVSIIGDCMLTGAVARVRVLRGDVLVAPPPALIQHHTMLSRPSINCSEVRLLLADFDTLVSVLTRDSSLLIMSTAAFQIDNVSGVLKQCVCTRRRLPFMCRNERVANVRHTDVRVGWLVGGLTLQPICTHDAASCQSSNTHHISA
jgi:hypothetical protein